MDRFLKRLAATLALGVLIALGASAPANASTVNECPDDNICLWDYNNGWSGGGPTRKFHVQYLYGPVGRCMSFEDEFYSSPYSYESLNNTVGSFVLNSPTESSHDGITFFNWNGCNAGGGSVTYPGIYVNSVGVPPGWLNNGIGSMRYCEDCL